MEPELRQQSLPADRIFKTFFRGTTNLITPKVVKYHKQGRLACELSSGEDENHQPIFGVTVLSFRRGVWKQPDEDPSCMFKDQERAQCFIDRLLYGGGTA